MLNRLRCQARQQAWMKSLWMKDRFLFNISREQGRDRKKSCAKNKYRNGRKETLDLISAINLNSRCHLRKITSFLCAPVSWSPAYVLSQFSPIWLFMILWIIAHQAPLSMGFSRQEYWSGLPCPPPGDLLDTGVELASACVSCIASRFFTNWATWEAPLDHLMAL